MKVEKLIEILSAMPKDADVVISEVDYEYAVYSFCSVDSSVRHDAEHNEVVLSAGVFRRHVNYVYNPEH